jgi:hypothetical protein
VTDLPVDPSLLDPAFGVLLPLLVVQPLLFDNPRSLTFLLGLGSLPGIVACLLQALLALLLNPIFVELVVRHFY